MTTTTVQSRVELKYCVPEAVAADVLAEARNYLVPEPLARGPRQHITSLYLDTEELTFLRWHREGATERHKLRIRAYGSLPAATLYLELKSKNGQMVRKERMPFIGVLRDAVLTECRARYGATPQTLVNVVRESLREPGLATAVTVDRSLRYQATTHGEMVGDARQWRALPLPPCAGPAPVLMELKYGAEAPEWMQALKQQLAPWRISFSKYATAMTHADADLEETRALSLVVPGFGPEIGSAA